MVLRFFFRYLTLIILINRSNIYEHFPTLALGLSRAVGNTSIGKYWDFDSLFQNIINFECYAFIEDVSGYCGVFQYTESPKSKTLNFFWSGKISSNPNPVDWDLIDGFLESAAQEKGCNYIQCEGRRGWAKILAERGYFEDSVLFTREVPNESSEI